MSGPKRRVLKDFRIEEVSAVDRPAQRGAEALIMKRDDGDVAKRAVLTDPDFEHQHLVHFNEDVRSGQTSSEVGHSHSWTIGEDGAIQIGMVLGHNHGGRIVSIGKSEGVEDMSGTALEKRTTAEQKLDEAAERMAKAQGIDFYKAYGKVLQTSEGKTLYAEYCDAADRMYRGQ